MMTTIRILSTTLLLSCGAANAVELIADERRVEVFSSDGNSEARPDPAFSAFSVSGQTSEVSPTLFDASGNGFGESDFDFFVRQSYFDITFSAIAGETITLSGTGLANAGSFGFAEVRVRLFSGSEIDNAQLVYSDAVASDGFVDVEGDFDVEQTLQAGVYRLVVQTDVTPGGFGTFAEFTINARFTSDPPLDQDGDGVVDSSDNCTLSANPSQFDGDADGYGNACDADFTNDCATNVADLGVLRGSFFSADPITDLNEDGVVNVGDLGVLRALFFQLPGPSGLTELCGSQ